MDSCVLLPQAVASAFPARQKLQRLQRPAAGAGGVNRWVSDSSGLVYRLSDPTDVPAWLKMAVAAGEISLPRGIDMDTLYNAVYSGPVMPWIDPVKEANAWKTQIRGGATESDWVRASRNPDDVKSRRKAEKLMKTKKWGWCLTLTPPMIKEAPVPKSKNRAATVRKPA
jgi:capsid protein